MKKMSQKMPQKMPKKHYESQVENKLAFKHNKYGTLACLIANNLYVL